MSRFVLSLLLLAVNTGPSVAQEIAIVLTGTLYDRDVTAEEEAMAKERADQATKDGEQSSYSLEALRILNARAKTLNRVSTTTILGVGKSVKCIADAQDILLEAHLSVIKIDDKTCELEANWGVGAIIGHMTGSLNTFGKKTLELNRLQFIGASGGGNLVNGKLQGGWHLVQTMEIIPGKEHPLTSNRIGENLSLELSRRIQIPRPGKITNR